jgi:hypothetical protein
MLSITGHKGNANQNDIEVSSPIRMAVIKNTTVVRMAEWSKNTTANIGEDVRKRNAYSLLVGM